MLLILIHQLWLTRLQRRVGGLRRVGVHRCSQRDSQVRCPHRAPASQTNTTCCLWAGHRSSVFSWPIRTWRALSSQHTVRTSATMKHLDDTSGLSYCSHRGAEGVGGWGDQLEVIYSDSQWASNNNHNPHNQHTRLWTLIGSSLGSRVTCLQVSTDTKIKLTSSIR